MKKRSKTPAKEGKSANVLRKRAEAVLISSPGQKESSKKNEKSANQLLHELQVYQVELEMQNDELRRSQEALEEEKSRFATIFNLAPVGYMVLDRATVILDCNEMALSLFNGGKNALVGKRFQNFVSGESGDQLYFFVKKLLDQGRTALAQLPFISASGRRFYGQVQGTMVKTSDGSNALFYFTIIDVTEKHLADLKLQETTERLQIALRASLSGILSIDLRTGVVQPDDFVLGLFKIKDKEFDGRLDSLYERMNPEDVARINPLVLKALSQQGNLNEIFRIESDKSDTKYIEIHGKIVSIESQNDIFIALLSDVTLKETQRILAEKVTQERQNEVLRTILKTQEEERLRISNALHDSLGQLLYSASLKLQNSVEVNDVYFSQAASLIDQAIRETRKISFELAPSVLVDYGLPVAVTEMVTRINSKNLTIEPRITGLKKRLPLTVETDVFRILQELVNNIVKHTGATKGLLSLRKVGGSVLLSVSDNGKGFDPESTGAHGTGLSSIRNRISLYGGRMKITSKPGKGTTVNIKLQNIRMQ